MPCNAPSLALKILPSNPVPAESGRIKLFAKADGLYTIDAAGNVLPVDLNASAFALTLLDDPDAASMRSTLGIVIGTNVQAHSSDLDSFVTNAVWTGPSVAFAGQVSASLFTGSGAGLANVPASGVTGGPAIRVYNTGGSFAIAAGANKIPWNAEDLDNTATFNPSNNRWTPQVAGWYLVGAELSCIFGTAGELVEIFLYKNGSRECNLGGGPFVAPDLAYQASGSALVHMNGTTDFLEWFSFNSTSGCTAEGTTGTQRYSYGWGHLVAGA
jgi:hypothetical protein